MVVCQNVVKARYVAGTRIGCVGEDIEEQYLAIAQKIVSETTGKKMGSLKARR
ncbi:hypothetical protein LCGC14_1093000 [marine sediment metagenome]|uniref:Uncharacterized protein n=1 Tax=marine sediment metagenome TaxID=412755 RepID=A0A0F9MZL3_9ZZZZ